LDIGIESDAASIGIPASGFSVRYRSIPVPDWAPLFWYWTAPCIGILINSSTGLIAAYILFIF
jgi:hypothetical protein